MRKDGQKRSKLGIGFRGSLVSVRWLKYVCEYERSSICWLSVSPYSTPDVGHLPSAFYYPPTGCSPFLSQSNLTRMPAMHTYETIRTDLLVVDSQKLFKLPARPS